MTRVIVYSTGTCPVCSRAKSMLEKWQIPYTEIRIDKDSAANQQFIEVTDGARTVPQIVIDGQSVGGFDELTELHMDGELDDLMPAD